MIILIESFLLGTLGERDSYFQEAAVANGLTDRFLEKVIDTLRLGFETLPDCWTLPTLYHLFAVGCGIDSVLSASRARKKIVCSTTLLTCQRAICLGAEPVSDHIDTAIGALEIVL